MFSFPIDLAFFPPILATNKIPGYLSIRALLSLDSDHNVLQKMRLVFALFGSVILTGCTATSEKQPDAKPRAARIATDFELVSHLLDALYRSERTSYGVIPDAASEEGMAQIPVVERNRVLRARLNQLRRPPRPVISVNVHSGDLSEFSGSGHLVYSYDTATGRFAAIGVHEIGEDASDMWIEVRHWPNGTRLVSLSHTWIDDLKDNIFHLRNGEEIFRFASAIEPLMD